LPRRRPRRRAQPLAAAVITAGYFFLRNIRASPS
jgi:hypothetical protein